MYRDNKRGKSPALITMVCRQLFIIILSLSFTSFTSLVWADEDMVPLRGTFKGWILTQSSIEPPVVHIESGGTGHATHLGRSEWFFSHDLNLTTYTWEGFFIFTAANGDELYVDTIGGVRPTEDSDIVVSFGDGVITGGTGRFENATGEFSLEALVNMATGEVKDATIDGIISEPLDDDNDDDDDDEDD